MQVAFGHGSENCGKLPCRACHADALERRLLGEVQHVHAVGEHRRVGRRQVEPAFLDFSEVGEQCCGGGAIPSNECAEIAQQNLISEMGKCVAAAGCGRKTA